MVFESFLQITDREIKNYMFGIKFLVKNKLSNAVENCGIQGQWKVLLASKHPHGQITFSREY